jgi:hypothetical protein
MGTISTETDPSPDRTAIALIVVDERGASIDAVVNGVTYRTPAPLSVDAAAAYIRLLLGGGRR